MQSAAQATSLDFAKLSTLKSCIPTIDKSLFMKKTLLFLFLTGTLSVYAQSPGGVSGTELWYKVMPVSSNLQGYYRWQDYSGDSIKLMQHRLTNPETTEFTQSRTSLHTINFHPAISLGEGTLSKSAYLTHSNLSQATIFGVFAPLSSTISRDMILYAVNGRKAAGTIVTKDKSIRVRGTEPLDYGNENGEDLLYTSSDSITENQFRETSPRIVTYLKADRPNFNMWGESQNASISFGTTYSTRDTDFNTTFDTSSFGNEEFDGYTPEYIVYNRYLTPIERRKVESYLAIKYGITLNGSYLDSEGNLIWDRDEQNQYHNRVAAFGRDINAGLLQPLSATSYEETPRFSSLKTNDSYYQSNSYNLPSEAHLLIMGREYGNAMPENGYVFWGDDNASTSTFTAPGDSLWHIMKRTWLVRTNIPANADSLMTRWTGNGLNVTSSGFIDNITQTEATAGSYAITPAMPEGYGAIEFRCPLTHPTFDVGFTSENNECTYGFRINSNGSVNTINNGLVSSGTIATGINGKIVSVRLNNRYLSIRIDGTGNSDRTFTISNTTGTVKGIIRTLSVDYPLYLTKVRTGGIGDTGNQAELSNRLTESEEFTSFSRRRTVMLIDQSGEGRFDTDDVTMIKCSDPDLARGKTMFHNIFWDSDGSGSDIFTFAYYDGIDINATPTPSACENGLPINNGSININVRFGTPIFNYILTVDTVAGMERGAEAAKGTFIKDEHNIKNLAPGTYTLTVMQGGGNDIYGTGNTSFSAYSHDTRSYLSGEMTWTAAETCSNYRIGLESTLTEDIIQYGFEVRENKVYAISDGYVSSTLLSTIEEGDILSIAINNRQITYMINGETVQRESTWSLRGWRFCIKYGNGETHITNLMINGKPVENFESYGNIQIETPKTNSVNLTVHVGSECDSTLPNGTEETNGKQEFNIQNNNVTNTEQNIFFVKENGNATRIYNATLDRNVTSATTLLVFDASGRMIDNKDMLGEAVKNAQFSVPGPGVYIIKALTADGKEFTKKIFAK